MGTLKVIGKIKPTQSGLSARLSDDFRLQIDLLEDWILRIAIVPDTDQQFGRTWMISPHGDTPWEGRDRLSLDGFTCPDFNRVNNELVGSKLRLRIEGQPLRLWVDQFIDEDWAPLFCDRENGAYQWFEQGNHFKHFQTLRPDEQYFGLGDKSGPLDKSGRRLRCLQSDALGYNAETSDPLYKHAPWVIALSQGVGGGLLYDTLAQIDFDLGAEHSNYFKPFRHAEIREQGMVLYVVAGPQISDIVPRLHALTGNPAFPPRWSLGFAFTTMHHADHPDAQQVITDFAQEARAKKLPISAIHLGSGYTAGADGLRYVFNWNENRFPNKFDFFKDLKSLGFRTCANIKPVLLTGHFAFEEADQKGWLVKSGDGDTAIEMFWGGQGANLDFTNKQSIDWWQNGVRQQVLGAGFDAVWNDNNEAELWDERATIDGFGAPLNGMAYRPIHALMMTRASFEATLEKTPNKRPFTISRAGPIGIGRYGETWSGDNNTSWHTLKWNLRQGLSMSLSGMPLVGHDIGGFDGPPPSPELLLRWFQMMALHPRCLMNSWKAKFENIPNLPWMHQEVFDQIKGALALRYQFLPLIYSRVHHAHESGHPVIAPSFYYYRDKACLRESDTFMLGPNVLVAPIVEENSLLARFYLPDSNAQWVDYHTGHIFMGGQEIEISSPLDCLPLMIRAGSTLPLATHWEENSPHDATQVEFLVFPGSHQGISKEEFFFDDGESWDYQSNECARIKTHLSWNNKEAHFHATETASGRGRPKITARLANHAPHKLTFKSDF